VHDLLNIPQAEFSEELPTPGEIFFFLVILGVLTCGFVFAADPFTHLDGRKIRFPLVAQILFRGA
jgi:hypothetical protein